MDKEKKFKVYVVADAYKWWDVSVYPDVFQNWIKQIEANPNEVDFMFRSVFMTEEQYNQTLSDLKKWNEQEAKGAKPPKKDELKNQKPTLKVVSDEPATVLQFPKRKDDGQKTDGH